MSWFYIYFEKSKRKKLAQQENLTLQYYLDLRHISNSHDYFFKQFSHKMINLSVLTQIKV
jgi:hypothetical protein